MYRRVELFSYMIVLVLVFWGTSMVFSVVTTPDYVSINGILRVFFFITSSPTCVICRLFDGSHFDRHEVISHCGFDLHFSGNYWYWTSFHLPVASVYILFGKAHLCKSSAQPFIGLFDFFWYWVVLAIYIFWILTPYHSYHLQVFSPSQ